jgi:ABC-type transport system involved in cytochrome bd biosynthesis fused ATPase/permease subunit
MALPVLAQQAAPPLWESPDIWDELTGLAVTLASLAVTVLSALLSYYAPAWLKAWIDQKHMKALHEAAMTYAETAMRSGLAPANSAAIEGFRRYAERSVPDALRALTPPPDVLAALLSRYLARSRDGGPT